MSCENYQEALGKLHDSLRTDSHEYEVSGQLSKKLSRICKRENGTFNPETDPLVRTSKRLLSRYGVQVKPSKSG